MKSRVEVKARELLAEGHKLSKYDLVQKAFCDQRVAQRILKRIHESVQEVRIVRWTTKHNTPIPVYGVSERSDKPRPKPLTLKERARRYYTQPDVRERRIKRGRAERLIKRNPHDVLAADPFGVFYRSVDQRTDRVLD